MALNDPANAGAWGLPKVLEYFDSRRASTNAVYESEWFFLRDRLREGMTVLDIGCAQGGFASILAEHLSEFRYTGVDINAEMIVRARSRHPEHVFHHVAEGDLSELDGERFDLVLVLGILHLHEAWRETIAAAWRLASGALIMDLRETDGPTIEDKGRSYFAMDFNGGGSEHAQARLPYIVVNSGQALATVRELCHGAGSIRRYGYDHAVSDAAHCPVPKVMTTAWCIESSGGS